MVEAIKTALQPRLQQITDELAQSGRYRHDRDGRRTLMDITIKLPDEKWNVVLAALGKQPAEVTMYVILEIQRQAREQMPINGSAPQTAAMQPFTSPTPKDE